MATVGRLIEVMEGIAPLSGAEAWDNVGLLVGDPGRDIAGPVLLTIDLTEAVAGEAIQMGAGGAGAVIAYHPVVFHPLKRITAGGRCGDAKGRVLLSLIEAGIAVYSPHTALDAAEGGVTDWLIDQIAGEGGVSARRALVSSAPADPNRTHKVVVFVPEGDLVDVRAAMSDAGAGVIGAYRSCSFGVAGRGTFFGGQGTSPRVGERGRLEEVEEIRLEMVCGEGALADVVAALRAAHPYEEPAFDVYRLEAAPGTRGTGAGVVAGAGRLATLGAPATVRELAARVKKNLGVPMVKVAVGGGPTQGRVETIAAVPGAGASMLDEAIGAGCEVFVTGEMRHHEMLAALERGCSVILAGHTNTERGYLPMLRDRIRAAEGAFDVRVSEKDRTAYDVV